MRLTTAFLPIALAAAAPRTCPSPAIANGDFGHQLDSWSVAQGAGSATIVSPGSSANGGSSRFSVQSSNLNSATRFALDQTVPFCPQVQYSCTFDYRFDKYYSVTNSDGSTSVPKIYVVVYASPSTGATSVSLQPGQGGVWLRHAFTFLPGSSPIPYKFELFASSPQAASAGTNAVRFDNIQCTHK